MHNAGKLWVYKMLQKLCSLQKLINLQLKEKSKKIFINNWKPIIDFLQEREREQLMNFGFED